MADYSYLTNYIISLKNDYGYDVSIRDFVGFLAKDPDVAKALIPFYVHHSPYCLYIKYSANLVKSCVNIGWKFMKKCNESSGPFIGTCYCGYSDYVIPVKYKGNTVAAVCIGGLDLTPSLSRQKMKNIQSHYDLDEYEMNEQYELSSKPQSADFDHMEKVCGIIADFINYYYRSLVDLGRINPSASYLPDNTKLTILADAMSYIQNHFAESIHIEDIAAHCHCSVSYISHIFQKNMNESVSSFINKKRLEHAKGLLAVDTLPLHQIAEECGYNDANYFSIVFRKYLGISPSGYRKILFSGSTQESETGHNPQE